MEIEHFYKLTSSNYQEVKERLGTDAVIKHFIFKFSRDNTFHVFKKAYQEKDIKTAFRAMHTLKGLCASLGFVSLFNSASALCDKLKEDKMPGALEVFLCEKKYNALMKHIRALSD